jgi:hypothetical protein
VSGFRIAIAGALAALRQGTGVDIVYHRNGREFPARAGVGRGTFAQDDGDGGVVSQFVTRDYFVAVSDLAEIGEPAEQDVIEEEIDGRLCRFEVVSPGDEPAFRYSDAGRTQFRIHTQEVGACDGG